MDLDCAFKFGLSRDVVKQNRKDWSLAHDVKLLKYLEKFSQNLISRASDAVKSLEDFEKDLYFVSLNIQTVSQRFQSLANKQFIEHCVLEDDISTYSKASESKTDVSSSASNLLLNNALSSCLTSFHYRYSTYKDGYSVTKLKHVPGAVDSDRYLPPLIGTIDFNEYYGSLLSSKEYFGEPMKKSVVNSEDNFSDKQSLQDTISLCSSSNVVPDNDLNNALYENHGNLNDDASTSNNFSHEPPQQRNQDLNVRPLDKNNKHIDSRSWVPQDNSFFNSNGCDSVIPTQKNSLFDDDDDEEGDDDLFLFARTKPFSIKAFTEENDVVQQPVSQDVNTIDESDGEAVNKNILPQSNNVKNSNYKNISEVINESNGKVSKDNSFSPIVTDRYSGDSERKITLPYKYSDTSKNNQISTEQTATTLNRDAEINRPAFESTAEFKSTSCSKQESSKTSLLVSDSTTTKKFSLFSDQEESDDELFSSVKQKQAKENFKKVLEEKISAFGSFKDNIKPTGKINKTNISNSNGPEKEKKESSPRNTSLDLPVGKNEESGSLPNYNTPMLQSLVKNRPKIRNKRRPPSRKHLKGLQSANADNVDNSKEEGMEQSSDQSSNNTFSVLSPSTEEEDLFIVPTTSMTHEVSCSNLFLASSLLSPGSSLDNQNSSSDFVCEDKCMSDPNNSSISTAGKSEGSTAKNTFLSPESSLSDASNKELNKKIESTSNAFWNNNISLFNDSEDDDDLFSSNSSKKSYEKKPSDINPKSNLIPPPDNLSHNKFDKDFFKDVFSNDSDDDDLFKVKETTAFSRTKPDSHITKVKDERENPKYESNGNKLLKASTTDFKDPLSCFDEHQAE